MNDTEPSKLVGIIGAAEILGVTRQRVYVLMKARGFPKPYDFVDGDRPVWRRKAMVNYASKRAS